MGYDLNQDEAVGDQEEQSGQPDQQEGVVAFKLQEVGWAQPNSLIVKRKEKYFCIVRSILVISFKIKTIVYYI